MKTLEEYMPNNMRSALAAATQRTRGRDRSNSTISTVPPAEDSEDYLPELAAVAASILYRSPVLSKDGRPVYILNAAAFPDACEVDYDSLLAYVLARLPGEDELISGTEYEVVFFAGGPPDNATAEKKQGPPTGWYLQAYHVLSRALRKKLQMLYIVHPRTWVRVLINIFGTIVSPKFRRKIVHVNSLSALALNIPIEKLLIPPSAYLQDRQRSSDIYVPFATGRRAFGVRNPFPKTTTTGKPRLPRVLRETTSFLLIPANVRTEGLFRVPPHALLISVLKEAYDRGQEWIVWKEKDTMFVQPGIDRHLVDEIRLEDAYGVHLAASLIKTWYRELREPIFGESAYAELRERYNDPEADVSPEDLVDFILPTSSTSPLTSTAREILTRHLLPLLSEIAIHEPDNKMNPENLAICFAMCLVSGSDQMMDAKVSSIVKRILEAAIIMWPQLRVGMGIDGRAFMEDLQPPIDPNDYEDPLEDNRPRSMRLDGEEKKWNGYRNSMHDVSDNSDSASEKPPALPPRRRSRGMSLKAALTPHMPNVELPKLPKRKPPPLSEPEVTQRLDSGPPTSDEPPRYSDIFGREPRNAVRSSSPRSYAPDTSARSTSGSRFETSDEKKRHSVGGTTPQVPKRKPVSRQSSTRSDGRPTCLKPAPPDLPTGSNALMAEMSARQAARNSLHSEPSPSTEYPRKPAPTDLSVKPISSSSSPPKTTDHDGPFRRPSWPASAHKQGPPTIQSLAKPVLPTRPISIITSHDGNSSAPVAGGSSSPNNNNQNLLAPGQLPKPRAPSPGLLNRMSSFERRTSESTSPSSLEPHHITLRKSSVDDIKRLYEERASVARTLVEAGKMRKASSSSSTTENHS
jgi:Rho GTPase-activating protein 1